MQKSTFQLYTLWTALLPGARALAFFNCPLPGPIFPAPTNLSLSPTIQSAISNLTSLLQEAISSENSIYGPFDSTNTSYSLEIFSTYETDPLFVQSYAAPAVSSYEYGSTSIDSNTIYRVGSLTKVFTVYTFLLEAGDLIFNSPITNYVPELALAAQTLNATLNPLNYVSWESVTIGDLASQLGGIGRDYAELGQLTEEGINGVALGLPPLNASEIPPCGIDPLCTRAQFFEGFIQRHPVHAPSISPTYSNVAFQILGYALENITGKSFQTSMEESLFTPLGLENTFYALPPENKTAVIPDAYAFYYDVSLGDESP